MKIIRLLVLFFCLLIPSMIVRAKGNFTYLTVKGPGITGELTITNPVLTESLMAFADFSRGAIDAPADPGEGYQIIRVYVVDNKAQLFDQLHYYPYSGYVYYDGLAEGTSEYDGKWYAANIEANEPFRDALAQRARLSWVTFGVFIILVVIFVVTYYRKPRS